MRTTVVAAVIEEGGRVLVARRAGGAHAGRWEFPGGKVGDGESPHAALVREIREELGVDIEVDPGPPILEVPFEVDGAPYVLAAYRATRLRGEYRAREHDLLRWVAPGQLTELDLTPPDVPVARVLASRGADS